MHDRTTSRVTFSEEGLKKLNEALRTGNNGLISRVFTGVSVNYSEDFLREEKDDEKKGFLQFFQESVDETSLSLERCVEKLMLCGSELVLDEEELSPDIIAGFPQDVFQRVMKRFGSDSVRQQLVSGAILFFGANLKDYAEKFQPEKMPLVGTVYCTINKKLEQNALLLSALNQLKRAVKDKVRTPSREFLDVSDSLIELAGFEFKAVLKNPGYDIHLIASLLKLANLIYMMPHSWSIHQAALKRLQDLHDQTHDNGMRPINDIISEIENISNLLSSLNSIKLEMDKLPEDTIIWKKRYSLWYGQCKQAAQALNSGCAEFNELNDSMHEACDVVRNVVTLKRELDANSDRDIKIYRAGRDVLCEADKVASVLLKNDGKNQRADVQAFNTVVHSAASAVKHQGTVHARDGVMTLRKQAFACAGKPSFWKKLAGAVMCLAGVVVLGLSIAGIPFTGGASMLGTYAAGSLFAAGGAALFYHGTHRSLSKKALTLADAGEPPKQMGDLRQRLV